jgi:ketosteroid isomerase-like protein
MSEQTNDETTALGVVTELANRFQSGDFAGASRLFDPEIRLQQPASLPHGGWHVGSAGMATMGAVFARFWDRSIDNPRIIGSADSAVQVTTQTWTAKETGRAATVDVVELFTVAGGLISEIRVFQQDTHLLLETLEPLTD